MANGDLGQIQKSLTQRMRGSMDAAAIKELAGTISTLHGAGIHVDDVFPYGIPTQQHGVSIRAHLTPEQLKTIGDLIPKMGGIGNLQVFPRGIINPDKFRLHLNMPR